MVVGGSQRVDIATADIAGLLQGRSSPWKPILPVVHDEEIGHQPRVTTGDAEADTGTF